MSDFSDSNKTSITFKSWPHVKGEVLAAIREIAPEPLAQKVFPSTIHIEGYPGPGITTSVFRATSSLTFARAVLGYGKP